MELLLLLPTGNEKSVSVNAKRMALLTASVTATFPSPTVISAGILPTTVIIMAMICTCLLIPKVTYRYFLIFAVLPNMIHMDSCMLFFRMKSFLPDYTVSKVLLDSAHDARYGRTVHLVMKANPRLFNNPPSMGFAI